MGRLKYNGPLFLSVSYTTPIMKRRTKKQMKTRYEVSLKLEEIMKELEKLSEDLNLDNEDENCDVHLDLMDIRNYILEKQKKIEG